LVPQSYGFGAFLTKVHGNGYTIVWPEFTMFLILVQVSDAIRETIIFLNRHKRYPGKPAALTDSVLGKLVLKCTRYGFNSFYDFHSSTLS